MEIPKLNLAFGWLWILCGFVSGMLLGMHFHKENWLGGYNSHQRRLYRLAHISFFGLAIINLLFGFTCRFFPFPGFLLTFAGFTFVIGAVAMPVCCVIAANRGEARGYFAVPVISLLAGGGSVFWEVLKL